MTDQVQENATALDALKLAAGVVILAAGIAGFYLLVDLPIWLRWIIVLAALVAGALVSLQSYQGKTFWQFVQSSRIELRKVVWPTRQETTRTMWVVIAVVILMSLMLAGMDLVIQAAVKWLLGNA